MLVFHGYLLRGTGSNVYNASLAPALAGLGHEVHLLCQDRDAGALEWVDRVGRWQEGELVVEGTPAPGESSVTAYAPEIGGLLPVYVRDAYEGFEVREFGELTEGELERYLEANVAAVRDVARAAGGVDAALANHLVMGPVVLARAALGEHGLGPDRYAVKVHGSALEYTVKPQPQRFLPYAREGLARAAAVLVGSRHTAESLWAALDDPDLPARTRLGPPGVDTTLFHPISSEKATVRLHRLVSKLRSEAPREEDRADRRRVARRGGPPPVARRPQAEDAGGGAPRQDPPPQRSDPPASAWGRDPDTAAEAIEWWAEARGPRVVFVGKLIVSKGLDLLLAAWPLVVARDPGARLLVVGFGEYGDALRRLWNAIERADTEEVGEVAARGRALEGGPEEPLRMLGAFLENLPDEYGPASAAAAGSVGFAGRLEHDEVGALVPCAEALVFPSSFPEAFGMVAAEVAAAGVLPVSAAHSGALEVSRELAAALPGEASHLVSFPVGDGAVEAIASRINGWLALGGEDRERARRALVETATRLWSWEGVARGVVAAAGGELDALPAAVSE